MSQDPVETAPPEDGTPHDDGLRGTRRPGEGIFALLLTVGSAVLLWNAYGISGFESLSSPGAVPMATTFVMLATAAAVTVATFRRPRTRHETFTGAIVPGAVALMAVMIVAYALLLKPLGFLPTSFLFLVAAVKLLSSRGWVFTLAVSLGSLAAIYLIFRIVFTVLMPAGVVPEAEILHWVRSLGAGGAS